MKAIQTMNKNILSWSSIILLGVIAHSNNVFGQLPTDWSPSNKAGNIIIQSTQPGNSGYDIDITRSSTSAGLKIFNENTSGRSLVLFGQGYGGKYGYLAHHSQSHVSDPGYTLTFKPSSTVLIGADINGLGIVSVQDIRFNSGGAEDSKLKMIINSSGNVGISTALPNEKLEVKGNLRIVGSSDYTHSELQFFRGGGTKFASIGQADLNNANSTFDIKEFNGNDIRFVCAGTERLRIRSFDDNVGIGTNSPTQKLQVNGTVYSKEVKVDLAAGSGPDYVFEEDYNLPSLDSIKTYIDQHKHLPEVPSAKEMEANGVNLGEMNMLLLKKIEELTLYVIELKSELDKVKQSQK